MFENVRTNVRQVTARCTKGRKRREQWRESLLGEMTKQPLYTVCAALYEEGVLGGTGRRIKRGTLNSRDNFSPVCPL